MTQVNTAGACLARQLLYRLGDSNATLDALDLVACFVVFVGSITRLIISGLFRRGPPSGWARYRARSS